MMKQIRYLFLAAIFLWLKIPVQAQITMGTAVALPITGTVKGRVTDRSSGKAISGVSILAKTKDSVLLTYTFTDDKGNYTMSKLPFDTEFKLFAVLYGYHNDTSAVQKIRFPGTISLTKDWELSADLNTLNEVAIEARKPPFVIRKDTLEFDATAFKLLPHAILEDLLRRLPGILIDKDGGITVNGKKATKIQVDGHDFFGGNLSVATQNLTAGIIDKIQVTPTENLAGKFDKMLKPAADDVTINVLLKKNSNTGFIGNIAGGYGTRDRYTGNGFLSALGGKLRYGLYGSAGNGNSGSAGTSMLAAGSSGITGSGGGGMLSVAGTSGAGVLGLGGSGGSGGSRGSAGMTSGGLKDQKNISGTFNTDLGKKVKIDGNYSYGYQKSIREKQTERFNFQDSGGLAYYERQSGWNNNNNHAYTANVQFTPNSLTSWRFMPGLNYSPYQKEERTLASNVGADGNKINSSDNFNQSAGTRKGFRHSLFFGKRSRDGKTGFMLNWNVNADQTNESLSNRSKNEFFNMVPGNESQNSTDQKGNAKENSFNNTVSVQLSRNLGKSLTAAIEYQLNQESSRKIKDLFNLNVPSNQYNDRDELQSGDNKSNNLQQTAFFQLAYRGERLNAALNTGMRFISQRNQLFLQDTIIRNKQRQFAPKLVLNYSFANHSNVNLSYDIASNVPSPEQLSPIADSSNPLLILIGNPFLKTSLGHNINAGFSKFIPQKEMSMNVMGNGSFTKNQIVQDINYDTQGRQVQSFRNVDGFRSLRLSAGVQRGYHVKELSIQPSVNLSLNNTNDVGYINLKRNETKQWQYGGNLGIAFNYRAFVSVSPSANVSFTQTDYSLSEHEDLNYNTQNYSITMKISPASRIEFGSQLSYQYNSQIPAAFKRSATVLNSNVTWRFLKKEQLSLKLFVNDVFNNAIATSTVVTPSFRENTNFNTLRRYFLFSLQYNFNGLGGGPAFISR